MNEFSLNVKWWNQLNEFLGFIGEPAARFAEAHEYRHEFPQDAAKKIWLDRQLAKPEFQPCVSQL